MTLLVTVNINFYTVATYEDLKLTFF